MSKFKPAKKKGKGPAAPPGGLACVVLVGILLVLGMLFLMYVMGHANG